MEKEIAKIELSKELDFDLKLEGTQVKLLLKYHGEGGGAEIAAFVSAEYFLDKLKDLIPGTFDDMAIDAAKALLKK